MGVASGVRMGMQRENVSGWDEFSKLMTRLEEGDVSIYVLFVGETLAETGKNWCPDCVKGIIRDASVRSF